MTLRAVMGLGEGPRKAGILSTNGMWSLVGAKEFFHSNREEDRADGHRFKHLSQFG